MTPTSRQRLLPSLLPLEPRLLFTTLSVADASALESAGVLSFPVSLDAPASRDVFLSVSTASGTATAGRDFVPLSSRIRIPAGQTAATLKVRILNDHLYENTETFRLNLRASGASLATRFATGSILNDDAAPSIDISDARIPEFSSGTRKATLTLRLSSPSALPVTVHYATSDGSLLANTNYIAASGHLTFRPGQTSRTISLTLKPDHPAAGSFDSFFVTLSSPSHASLSNTLAVVAVLSKTAPRNTSIRPVLASADDYYGTAKFASVDLRRVTTLGDGSQVWAIIPSGAPHYLSDYPGSVPAAYTHASAIVFPVGTVYYAANNPSYTTVGGTTVSTVNTSGGNYLAGDINGDGRITADDYLLLDRLSTGSITDNSNLASGGIIKSGAGSLILTGSGTLTGSTSSTGGMMVGAINADDYALLDRGYGQSTGGTLTITSTPTISLAGTLTGATTSTGSTSTGGTVNLSGGMLNLSGSTSTGSGLIVQTNQNALTRLGIDPSLFIHALLTYSFSENQVHLAGTTLDAVAAFLKSGSANGAWNGTGIVSTQARNDADHRTAVGYVQDGSGVRLQVALYGDANLDGKVDQADLDILTQHLNTSATGWANGDFNYDGVINADDLALLDRNLGRSL